MKDNRDFAATVAQAQPPVAVNVECGGAPGAAAASLPAFSQQADQYLAAETKPLFLVPLWAWLLLGAAGAAWWFWGRKHISIKW